METALYGLTFIPMVLLALVVHEAGHLITARIMGIRTTEFQIGIGPRLAQLRTGSVRIMLPPDKEKPRPGETVHVWVDEIPGDPGGRTAYRGVEWARPVKTRMRVYFRLRLPGKRPEETPKPDSPANSYPLLSGRVRTTDEDGFTMTGHTWTLAAIPLMAMVHIAEDPGERLYGFFNTSPWLSRMTVIFAGVGANMVLLLAVFIALALWPASPIPQEAILVEYVEPRSPAGEAGMLPGDLIVQVNDTLLPGPEELNREVAGAHREGEAVRILTQRGEDQLAFRVTPHPEAGVIGIAYRTAPVGSSGSSGTMNRFVYVGEVYFGTFIDLFKGSSYGGDSEDSATPRFAGVITAAHYTAQAVEIGKLKAWVAVLGGVTLSMALVNILPVPPLDGFLVALHSVRAVRKNKPANPMLEQQLALYGMALIMALIIYLAIRDVQRLI